MIARAIAISTATPYLGYAAVDAAVFNEQNIACIDHTKQYFVRNQLQLWLYMSAIIVLIHAYHIDVGDDGIGHLVLNTSDMGW